MNELEQIVQTMLDEGQPNENIDAVIEEYQSRQKGKVTATAENAPAVVAEDTVSLSEPASLAIPEKVSAKDRLKEVAADADNIVTVAKSSTSGDTLDEFEGVDFGDGEPTEDEIRTKELKQRFDVGKFKQSEREIYEKYRSTGILELPEKEKEEPGFVDEVVNFVTNTVPKVYQDAQYMGSTMAYEDAVEGKAALEGREQRIRARAEEEGLSPEALEKQLSLFTDKAGRTIGSTREEAEAHYDAIIDKETKDIAEAVVNSSQYQDRMNVIGSARFFDDEGEWDGSMNDFYRVLGAQGPQMVASMATFGLWSGVQEAAGTSMEIARKKAAKRLGYTDQLFANMSKEDQAAAIIQVVKNGEADIDAAISAGLTTGILDATSNFVTFGGAKLIPKSLITKFTKQQVLSGAARIGSATVTEMATEVAQETQKGARVEAALDGRPSKELGFLPLGEMYDFAAKNPELVKETLVQSALVPGPMQIGGTVIRGGYKEGVKYIAGMNPDSAQSILNETKQELNKKFEEDKNAVYENKTLTQQERDSAINDLEKNYNDAIEGADVALGIVNSTKLKGLSPERKRKAFEKLSELPAESRKLADLKSKLEDGDANPDLELEIEDQEQKIKDINRSVLKERALDTMEKNGETLAEYVNSQKEGLFADKTITTFQTIEEAKQYIEANHKDSVSDPEVQALLEGKNNAIRLDNEAIIVKDTVEKGMDFGSFTGANSVQHEVLHFMLDSMDDAAVNKFVQDLENNLPVKDRKIAAAVAYAKARKKQYEDDGVKGRDLQEEFLTALSDGLQNYRIADIDLESGRTIRRVADALKNIFTGNTGNELDFSQINVTNTTQFLKNYNKFGKTGKIKVGDQVQKGKTAPSKVDKPVENDVTENITFEEGSINEAFSAYTHDGKVNNAPEDFHVMAAYEYEPLAGSVIDRISKIGLGKKGSKEQNNFIIEALSDQQTKEDLVSDLVYGTDRNKASSLLGLAKTYNPAVGSFGGYAKGFLAARAIRVLEERIGKQATQGAQTIDAPESREIISDDAIADDIRTTAEKLNLPQSILDKADKLAELAAIKADKALEGKTVSDLKKVNLRNKSFNDIFGKQLFKDIAGQLGKNTKKAADFTNYINNNFEALRDIALTNIDFQKGSGPAASWNLDDPPSKEEFLEYYEAKDEKTSTRSDRKKSLNNAIARSIADEARIEFAKKDPRTADLFKQKHGVVLAQKVDVPSTAPQILQYGGVQAMLKAYGIEYDYLLNTKESIDEFFTDMQPLLNVMPVDMISRTFLRPTPRIFKKGIGENKGRKSKIPEEVAYYNEINSYYDEKMEAAMAEAKSVNKNKFTGAAEGYVARAFEKMGMTIEQIKKNLENGYIQQENEKNMAMHRQMWDPLYNAILNNPKMARPIGWLMMRASDGGADHWHRMGGEMVGYSLDPVGSKGKAFIYEHAMQAKNAYLFLMDSALNGVDFDTAYKAMARNYKVIALDRYQDKKLTSAKFGEKMPEGWNVYEGSWTERYFNPTVGLFDGGIPPASIVDLDGNTMADLYNIDNNGHSTKAAVASKVDRLDTEFNQMLERVKGVKAEARYSEARADKLAANKGRFKFFVPYSAEDYMGLIYPTLGKGAEGDKNLEWYKENIIKPFARGISRFESDKQAAMENWRNLKKSLKGTPVELGKDAVRGFSNEEAVRVYLWNERDVVPESLSKKDTEALVNHVNSSPELKAFADQVVDITEGVDYPAPQKDWLVGTLTTDLVNFVNTSKRADFLQEWQEAVDVVYSKDNMNKLKAIYGENYVDALENMLYRMKTGRNRPAGQTKIENQFQNWINDSVGTVMFFNSRSAVLQTISAVNFLNWSDNNPIKAGVAFANQKQFWNDFAYLFNSDYLKQRRGGLKNDVNADEIAREAASATNKYKAALNAVLKAGFSPTQIADSFAIAVGGASFYRNRVNTYLKQGMDQKQAEEAAMLDFKETAEESQQSSRPDKVSMEQASSLGRIILAFANTPAQYTRLTKRAALDLINGRGDWKTNVSKLLYYGAVQNIIFTALQQALFAMSFDDEEEKEELYTKTANGIVDTLLRGSGVYGAGVATLKNIVMEVIRQQKSKRPDYTKAALKLTTLSPPVDTKIRKLMSAGRAFTYKQNKEDMREMGWDVDNPAALAVGQIASALGNVPLDRVILKMQNLKDAGNSEYETYQRIFLALGWSDWQLGIEDDKSEKPKTSGLKVTKGGFRKPKFRKPGFRTPAKRLERGVAGKAHRDGTIEVDPNLSPVEREKTIAHEKQHIKDIKAGKLDYDDNYVYWNGKKYPRKNGKIKYKGNWVEEGHPSLPWEKKAYDAEPSTKEIKEKKKQTKLY